MRAAQGATLRWAVHQTPGCRVDRRTTEHPGDDSTRTCCTRSLTKYTEVAVSLATLSPPCRLVPLPTRRPARASSAHSDGADAVDVVSTQRVTTPAAAGCRVEGAIPLLLFTRVLLPPFPPFRHSIKNSRIAVSLCVCVRVVLKFVFPSVCVCVLAVSRTVCDVDLR